MKSKGLKGLVNLYRISAWYTTSISSNAVFYVVRELLDVVGLYFRRKEIIDSIQDTEKTLEEVREKMKSASLQLDRVLQDLDRVLVYLGNDEFPMNLH